jgi:hypothetical protein
LTPVLVLSDAVITAWRQVSDPSKFLASPINTSRIMLQS